MDAAATFRSAVSDLEAGLDQQRRERPEIAFEQQPPPRKLAPYAAAIGATVHEPAARHGAAARPRGRGRPGHRDRMGAVSSSSTTRPGRPAGRGRSG